MGCMNRRVFIRAATGLLAAASLERAEAQAPSAVSTVRTSILEIGYHESGDAAGFPVILLHGFPDDAHAYDGVAPVLARAGYRAFVGVSARLRPDAVPRCPRAADRANRRQSGRT